MAKMSCRALGPEEAPLIRHPDAFSILSTDSRGEMAPSRRCASPEMRILPPTRPLRELRSKRPDSLTPYFRRARYWASKFIKEGELQPTSIRAATIARPSLSGREQACSSRVEDLATLLTRSPVSGHPLPALLSCESAGIPIMSTFNTVRGLTSALLTLLAVNASSIAAQTRTVQPVLSFPEAGLDDPAAYQGYQTRFFRDTKGNVVQIYLDARSGRVVNLLPDAVNESVGFTVRDGSGKPIRLEWGSPDAIISQAGNRRTIEYQLVANVPQILIGWILLGSMRVERDLGYSGRELELFDWPTFRLREQEELIANLDRLDPAERQRQLGFFNAGLTSDLRARLEPDLITTGVRDQRGVTAFQTTLDGKTNLQLDLSPDPRDASILVTLPIVSMRANSNRPIRFTVRVTTDAPPLTPLARDQIFNAAFLRFLNDARVAADRARGNAGKNADATATVSRYRQLERDARGTELLSSKEKLMAGLPNYATYFGRDMMMTSLMMQPVWTDAMPEFV